MQSIHKISEDCAPSEGKEGAEADEVEEERQNLMSEDHLDFLEEEDCDEDELVENFYSAREEDMEELLEREDPTVERNWIHNF